MSLSHATTLLALLLAVLPASEAAASPALPVVDVPGGSHLYQVWNSLSGSSLSTSDQLESWAGPDASGVWDGELWSGGARSVVVAVSSSASNQNRFGLYRDVATGGDKLTLFGAFSGDSLLGPVFDATFLFEDEQSVQEVGFWISSRGFLGTNTFHGKSELDRRSSFGHLASYHFGGPLEVATDEGPLSLQNAHLLAWEDWKDADYDDVVFVVGEAAPPAQVPEPGTGLLVAAGLALTLRRRG